MKKRAVIGVLALVLILALGGGLAAAKEVMDTEEGIIVDGVYAGNINLSGLTAGEAESAVREYIDGLEDRTVSLFECRSTPSHIIKGIGTQLSRMTQANSLKVSFV